MASYQLTVSIAMLFDEQRAILSGAKVVSEGRALFAIESRCEGSDDPWLPIIAETASGHIRGDGGPYVKVVSGECPDGHELRVRAFGMCSHSDVAYALKVTP